MITLPTGYALHQGDETDGELEGSYWWTHATAIGEPCDLEEQAQTAAWIHYARALQDLVRDLLQVADHESDKAGDPDILARARALVSVP
jgi:hypothetical protein